MHKTFSVIAILFAAFSIFVFMISAHIHDYIFQSFFLILDGFIIGYNINNIGGNNND